MSFVFRHLLCFLFLLPIYPSPYPPSIATPVPHPFFSLCLFVFCPYLTPVVFPVSSFQLTPSSSLSIFLSRLSHCVRLPIILSLSPSPMMLKFSPLHQFALTVNCAENNSHCGVAFPVLGIRQIGHDGKSHRPRNCAVRENPEPVQDKAK